MELVVEYHAEIPEEKCNMHNSFRIKSRLVATVAHNPHALSLKFRVEEDIFWMLPEGVTSPRTRGVWRCIGERIWYCNTYTNQVYGIENGHGQDAVLPSEVSIGEFYNTVMLLQTPSVHAKEVMWSLFWKLEIEPGFSLGTSWLKDAVPNWFNSMTELVHQRNRLIVKEVLDA